MAVDREPLTKELLERGSAAISRGMSSVRTLLPESRRYRVSYRSNIPLTSPRGISVEISSACNLRCRICHQWKDSEGKVSLTEIDIRRIIDDIARYFPDAVLEFSGQEPTLNANLLFHSLEYAKHRGVKTALSTNGMLLNWEFAKRLADAEPHHISVSLDSATPDIHDYLRDCKGSHRKVIQALKHLVQAKRRSNAGTAVSITTVVCDRNIEELSKIHTLGKMLHVDTINYNAFVLDNSYFLAEGEGYDNEFWVPSKRIGVLRKSIQGLLRLRKAGTYPIITNPEWQLREMPSYFEKREKYAARRCLAGYNYFHIHKQGDVTVCGKGPFLNVKQYSLRDIWHSLAFYKTRQRIKRCETPCINNCYVLE